jgi:serine/threonine protein kinase
MDKKRGCPSPNALVEFIQGRMVEPDLSEYSSHLELCLACQEKAKSLSPDDALIETLRGDAPVEDKIARDVPRPLIESLKQIPRRESSVGFHRVGRSLELGSPPDELELDFFAPAKQPDEIDRLGPYRVLKVLGKGGMGAVYLAEDPKLDRLVALKVMLPRTAANPTAKDRFLREARAAAKLKNDHVVTIYQVDEANGVPYVAMELLEGQSLDEVLSAGKPLGVAQILHIARDIAEGLAAAHEKGLVHRDIKPGNLWLEGSIEAGFRIKILDFGLARAALDESQMTQSGAIVGTPAYMAPEQAHGNKPVDERADLFSLGCVLYRLCAGEAPFQADTTIGTLMAVVLNDPVALSRRNDSIPPDISQLIMQLLAKDPSLRPQSAREVIARLTQIERATDGTNGTDETYGSNEIKRSHSFHTSHWILGLLAAVVVLAAGILFWPMPDGRVVRIESNDPSIQVAFAEGELKVTGAYKEPIALKPGKVDLRIVKTDATGNDFEFETDKLVVHKGEKVVLRIDVIEGQVRVVQAGKGVLDSKALSDAIESTDVDRRAAEWVLSLGGTVQVNGVESDITAVAELPKHRFSLTEVKLRRTAGVTDAGLAHLKEVKGLTSLRIDNTLVSDAGLGHLKDLRRLKNLDISNTKVTDDGLAVVKNFDSLETLFADTTAVTDVGLAHIKDLKKVTLLALGVTKVTDNGLIQIEGYSELRELSLYGTAVTDVGVARLKAFPHLKNLDLSYTAVTDTGVGELRSLKELATLHLRATNLTDEALAHLRDLKGLRFLNIIDIAVTAKGLADFHAAVPGCQVEREAKK